MSPVTKQKISDHCDQIEKLIPIQQRIISWAEASDAWRTVPRMILCGYAYLLNDVFSWYMLLEVPTTQQTGTLGALITSAPFIVNSYVNTGRKW